MNRFKKFSGPTLFCKGSCEVPQGELTHNKSYTTKNTKKKLLKEGGKLLLQQRKGERKTKTELNYKHLIYSFIVFIFGYLDMVKVVKHIETLTPNLDCVNYTNLVNCHSLTTTLT